MATTPVSVKQSAPASVSTPDVWRSLHSEMNRLLDRFMSGYGMTPLPSMRFDVPVGVASPAVDIAESDTAFKLSAELPGMTEQDIQVSLSGDRLTITGEKRQEREEKKENYYLTERSYGEFQRSFILPEGIDRDQVTAEFAKGVLTVTVPKSVQAEPKKIEVKAAT